jgi:hypothetical protein
MTRSAVTFCRYGRRAIRRVATVLALSTVGGAALAGEPVGTPSDSTPQATSEQNSAPPSEQDIDSWIESLGHDAYAVRQAAARKLLSAGTAARDRLSSAAECPDPESRAAARRLIALIDKAEFDEQLAAFAADADGSAGRSLPGWDRYKKLVGSDFAARTLFVEMQRSEAGLLADAFRNDGSSPRQRWEDRLVRLLRWPVGLENGPAMPPLGSCATMVFLSATHEGRVSDRTAMYIPQLVQRPPIQQALQANATNDAVRRLVTAWVVECPNNSDPVLQQRLNLALVQEMPEGVPLAVRVATRDPDFFTVNPGVRAVALLLIAKLGRTADAEKLEPLLEDATVCQTFARMPAAGGGAIRDIQIRDVALVTMLHLTGQDPADYGYRQVRRQSQQLLDPGSLFTEGDEQRAAAISKWHEWRTKQRRDVAPQATTN